MRGIPILRKWYRGKYIVVVIIITVNGAQISYILATYGFSSPGRI